MNRAERLAKKNNFNKVKTDKHTDLGNISSPKTTVVKNFKANLIVENNSTTLEDLQYNAMCLETLVVDIQQEILKNKIRQLALKHKSQETSSKPQETKVASETKTDTPIKKELGFFGRMREHSRRLLKRGK